jgi:hypothetical protein
VDADPEMLAPNAFEVAILERMARERPSLVLDLEHLRVQRRRYTGVGSYTDFFSDGTGSRDTVKLEARISMPGIRGGMGAALVACGDRPASLETFTCRDEFWSGAFDGFTVG